MELESERLILIGRLVASIVHEVNNPMQAIRGALALTLEEIEDVESVRAYTELCLQETDRVIRLTSLLRHIYRPETDQFEIVDLNQVVSDDLVLLRDELNRQRIEVFAQYAPGRLVMEAISNQLELALLYLLLFLAPLLAEAGVRKLQIQTAAVDDQVQIEFIIPAANLPSQARLMGLFSDPDLSSAAEADDNLLKSDLTPVNAIIGLHKGQFLHHPEPDRQVICIRFPSHSKP